MKSSVKTLAVDDGAAMPELAKKRVRQTKQRVSNAAVDPNNPNSTLNNGHTPRVVNDGTRGRV